MNEELNVEVPPNISGMTRLLLVVIFKWLANMELIDEDEMVNLIDTIWPTMDKKNKEMMDFAVAIFFANSDMKDFETLGKMVEEAIAENDLKNLLKTFKVDQQETE